MSDADSKVWQWATKRNGDPLTTRDVVELVKAVHEDGESRHKETMDVVRPLAEEFAEHCRTEPARMAEAVKASRGLSAEEVRTLISAEHSGRHGEHMRDFHASRRADDPAGDDHRQERGGEGEEQRRQHWLMWLVGSKVAAWVGQAVVAGGAGALVAFLIAK